MNQVSQKSEEISRFQGLNITINIENIRKKTLVLDLDETLVHAFYTLIKDYDFRFNVEFTSLL